MWDDKRKGLGNIISELTNLISKPEELKSYLDKLHYISDFLPEKLDLSKIYKKPTGLEQLLYKLPVYTDHAKMFISTWVGMSDVKAVLDVDAGIGELLHLVEKQFPGIYKKGYNSSDCYSQFNKYAIGEFLEYVHNRDHLLQNESKKFDIIISGSVMNINRQFPFMGHEPVFFRRCAELLTENGRMLVIVNEDIFHLVIGGAFFNHLNVLGLKITALIGVGNDYLRFDLESESTFSKKHHYFMLIEKGKQEQIFSAKLSEKTDMKSLLEHYRQKTEGKKLVDGIWLSKLKLLPIEKLQDQKDIAIQLKRASNTAVKFSGIAKFKKPEDITGPFMTISIKGGFISFSNKPEKYINKKILCFEIDTSKVDIRYLETFFKSSFGKKIVAAYSNGFGIVKYLNPFHFKELSIPLPDLEGQQRMLKLDKRLKEVSADLQLMKGSLWERPRDLLRLEKELYYKISSVENIHLYNRLPFPLATIAWGYQTEKTSHKKLEYLFNFFEGLGQFLDTVIVSFLIADSSFYESTAKSWLIDETYADWPKTPSFGSWTNLFAKLSKKIRGMYGDKKEKEFILELFKNADEDFFKLLTSKELVNQMDQTNQLRNSYKGHGGISTEKQTSMVLSQLEAIYEPLLIDLVKAFKCMVFIKPVPKTMDLDELSGKYRTTCYHLTGSATKFVQEEVDTNEPIASKKWYVLVNGQHDAVEILPYIQVSLQHESGQLACYYYNRINCQDEVRMVSYHYEPQPEFTITDLQFNKWLYFLNPVND